MTESMPVFDVVVAGGAASGLALAAAVKQALGAGVSIAVVAGAPSAPDPAHPPLSKFHACPVDAYTPGGSVCL